MALAPVDERMHDPGPEPSWCESWTFDFAAGHGGLGGWARLTMFPNRRVAWYHGYCTGPNRQLVAVADTEVPLPRGLLEIRTTGLWADHICETPFDHWTLGLEAFALGVDDPAELYGRQMGDRVPLGFDLEWETTGDRLDHDGSDLRYELPCRVDGEILVGAEVIDFEGVGHRSHRWGPTPRWDEAWTQTWGRLDDGTRFTALVPHDGAGPSSGRVIAPTGDIVTVPVTMDDALDGRGLPNAARLQLGELEIGVEPTAVTPVELVDPGGRRVHAPRALCRHVATDGRSGVGWSEWSRPLP